MLGGNAARFYGFDTEKQQFRAEPPELLGTRASSSAGLREDEQRGRKNARVRARGVSRFSGRYGPTELFAARGH